MTTAQSVMLFGYSLSQAEFQLLLEIIKASILAGGAGLIAYLFNLASKKRELDAALFDELIKPRITRLHELNSQMLDVISDYEDLIDKMLNPDVSTGSTDYATARRMHIADTQSAIMEFCKVSLESRLNLILKRAKKSRYEIGEDSYNNIVSRTAFLTKNLPEIWTSFYIGKYSDLARQYNASQIDIEEFGSLVSLNAQIYALVSRRLINRLMSAIHDDFETVIKHRGGRNLLDKLPRVAVGMDALHTRVQGFLEQQRSSAARDVEVELGLRKG